MAKPIQEGAGWAVRVRVNGYDKYLSGFPTAQAARRAAEAQRTSILAYGKPAGLGPERTTLAAAFLDYGREVLPNRKGSEQDVRRINRYLRGGGLPVLKLTRCDIDAPGAAHFEVEVADEGERNIVNSLRAHRARQERTSAKSAALRRRLANLPVASVTRHDVQQLMDALKKEGIAGATIGLERAELRRLFNYTRRIWNWQVPACNPATDLVLPPVDNARDRVLTNAEWQAVLPRLEAYRNRYAAPAFRLLVSTAMRISEALVYTRWQHIDWDRKVLNLPDSKSGKRPVPLSPDAMQVLRELRERRPDEPPSGRVFKTTYEALKKAWSTVCEQAGVAEVNPHDLRHTAATRYALELGGNMAMLQVITGHKTLAMLNRYINVDASMVASFMHGTPTALEHAPAGFTGTRGPGWVSAEQVAAMAEASPAAETQSAPLAENVVRVDFGRRAAA